MQDLSNFYATSATILSATLIAAVLEMRALRASIEPSGLHKAILILWTISLGVAGFALLDIPRALHEKDPGFLTDPDRLSLVISQAIAISVLIPLTALALSVLRSRPSTDHGDRSESPRGDAADSSPSSRVPKLLIALILVLAVARRRSEGPRDS